VLEKDRLGETLVAQAPRRSDDSFVRPFREHDSHAPATDLLETGFENVH
jgi:hypothetical protein